MPKCEHDIVVTPDPTSPLREIVRCAKCGAEKKRARSDAPLSAVNDNLDKEAPAP